MAEQETIFGKWAKEHGIPENATAFRKLLF